MTCKNPITPSDFKDNFPEFQGVKDSVIEKSIDRFNCMFDLCGCDLKPCMAVELAGLWIAHDLTEKASMQLGGSSGAEYTSQRVGEAAWTKDSEIAKKQFLNPLLADPYGRKFSNLMRLYCGGIYTT